MADVVVLLLVAALLAGPVRSGRVRTSTTATGMGWRGTRRFPRGGRLVEAEATVDLPSQLAQVAALVRSGSSAADAWRTLPGPPGGGVSTDGRARAAATAAARLSATTGCPLEEALEIIVAGLRADAVVAAAVEAGLAGPRSTVRVLVGLPVIGLGLAGLLGANPLAVLTGGGPGSLAGSVGAGLIVIGWRWSRALLRAAT